MTSVRRLNFIEKLFLPSSAVKLKEKCAYGVMTAIWRK